MPYVFETDSLLLLVMAVSGKTLCCVGDDCVLPLTQGIAGRRGLAGTIVVNKVIH